MEKTIQEIEKEIQNLENGVLPESHVYDMKEANRRKTLLLQILAEKKKKEEQFEERKRISLQVIFLIKEELRNIFSSSIIHFDSFSVRSEVKGSSKRTILQIEYFEDLESLFQKKNLNLSTESSN